MPEHPNTGEGPSDSTLPVEPPSTLDSTRDTRRTVDSCCQIAQESELERHPTQCDQGGCQRSTSGSRSGSCSPPCFDPLTRGPCYQSNCQDGCSTGLNISCTLDSPSLECHRGARSLTAEEYRDCCHDCAPKTLSRCGQACSVGAGAVDDNKNNVVASTMESDCHCNSVPTSTADSENDAASAVEDDCCTVCVSKDLSASGQACPVGTRGTTDNEDNAVASTRTASRAYAELSPLCI